MTHDPSTVARDDIAYMKSLAQAGRSAPLLHGPVLVAAAVIFGGAAAFQWGYDAGAVSLPPMAQLWAWVASGTVFAVALALILRRAAAKPGYATSVNHATGVAWSGTGFLIFTLWAAMMAIGLIENDWTFMRLMPSLIFAAYGSAWSVSGSMTGQKWMNAVAVLSFVGAVALAPLSTQVALYPAFLALMLVVVLIPGLYLMRREAAGRA